MYILTVPTNVKNFYITFNVKGNDKYLKQWTDDSIKIRKINSKPEDVPGVELVPSGVKPIFCGVDVRGYRKDWSFDTWIDPARHAFYRDLGIHIDEIVDIIPALWIDMGLSYKLWQFLKKIHLVW